jgi:hypothetical protein
MCCIDMEFVTYLLTNDQKQQCINIGLVSRIALFSNFKMKLKGYFEIMSDVQRESWAALDSIKENDFHSAFEAWKNSGISISL